MRRKDVEIMELKAKNAELEQALAESKINTDMYYWMIESLNRESHLGLWIVYFNEKGEQTSVLLSDEMRRLLGGYNTSELPNSIDSLVKLMHPDDTESVLAAFGVALSDPKAKYSVNYRLKMKGGDYRLFIQRESVSAVRTEL